MIENQKKKIKNEIGLNIKSIPVIILCLVLIYALGEIKGHIMLLKPSFLLNIITFIISLIAFIYSVLKSIKTMTIFFLITTILLFINFFYPIIK